jgi:hypothetical protein
VAWIKQHKQTEIQSHTSVFISLVSMQCLSEKNNDVHTQLRDKTQNNIYKTNKRMQSRKYHVLSRCFYNIDVVLSVLLQTYF